MVKLYLDEDVNILLVSLLRARNIEVTSTLERKMLGSTDVRQLEYASSIDSALVTHNRVDFENLFREFVQSGRTMTGIVILVRRDVHLMAQRLSRFCLQHERLENQLLYI